MMRDRKNLKSKWLHVRLTDDELKLLTGQYSSTTEPNLSGYARKILLGKPMIKAVRDESLQAILAELSVLRKDLNGIANNYNQMVHKLHLTTGDEALKRWVAQCLTERMQLLDSVRIIKEYIGKAQEKWLQY